MAGPLKEQRVAIVSFDGLSAAQFERLLPQMPLVHSLLEHGNLNELDATPFSDPQPTWAEILTGAPWYRNGCGGYGAPQRSLTELKLFSESDLCVEQTLLPEVDEGQCNIVVNIPLLEANGNRKWMAEASSPTLATVSPATLLLDEPFKSYRPRPIISMGKAMADPLAASKFMEAEASRAECSVALSKESDWKVFMYRASIFDQLAHLFGPSFLDDGQLKISAALKLLISKLDAALHKTLSGAGTVLFLSSFSHTPCQGLFSLNDLFQKLQLLTISLNDSEEQKLRKQAFAMINSETATPLVSPCNQILTSHTICASPIRGTVYVNAKDRFVDGIVSKDKIQIYEDRIFALLNDELRRVSGSSSLIRNTESNNLAPNFVVNLPGVDLVDSLSTTRRNYDLPHSAHSACGFVWSNAKNSKSLKSVEVSELITELA
ncbi:MAG: hypothetical protein JST89_17075 [Cyanobacteria bacterium SZAS-4]|nr:hypothetical protein [Cyanobacteria bacterium SZAS-4]